MAVLGVLQTQRSRKNYRLPYQGPDRFVVLGMRWHTVYRKKYSSGSSADLLRTLDRYPVAQPDP